MSIKKFSNKNKNTTYSYTDINIDLFNTKDIYTYSNMLAAFNSYQRINSHNIFKNSGFDFRSIKYLGVDNQHK